MAALRHGVARVRREIHEHLLELKGINSHAPQTVAGVKLNSMSSPINRGSVFAIALTAELSSTTRNA
jgi:hypothetical protein